MKKATKLLILFLSVVIGGVAMMNIFGRTDIGEELFMSQRDKQIAYLKEHEQEIVDFVKSQNSKIETVQIDWKSVSIGKVGNGTPQGAGWNLTILGKINNLNETEFTVNFLLEKENELPSIDDIGMLNSIYIFKDDGWYILK